MTRALIVGALLIGASISCGCGGCSDSFGCLNDDDCKGLRVCSNGSCQDPSEDESHESRNESTEHEGRQPHVSPTEAFDWGSSCGSVDCGVEEVCSGGDCRAVCGTDLDCDVGQLCKPRVEGAGRACVEGFECRSLGGDTGEGLCQNEFDCGEGGDAEVACVVTELADQWRCECLRDGAVTTTFDWLGDACTLIRQRDSVRYLCDWKTLFF